MRQVQEVAFGKQQVRGAGMGTLGTRIQGRWGVRSVMNGIFGYELYLSVIARWVSIKNDVS
jgi:hypothetical protein